MEQSLGAPAAMRAAVLKALGAPMEHARLQQGQQAQQQQQQSQEHGLPQPPRPQPPNAARHVAPQQHAVAAQENPLEPNQQRREYWQRQQRIQLARQQQQQQRETQSQRPSQPPKHQPPSPLVPQTQPQPQFQLPPQPQSQLYSQPQLQSRAQPQAQAQKQGQGQAQAQSQSHSPMHPPPHPSMHALAQPSPQSQPQPQPQSQSQPSSQPQPHAQPHSKSQVQTQTRPGDQPPQRLPLRSDTIRHLVSVLQQMRRILGSARAHADPRYRTVLRLLRAHMRPLRHANFSFAQLQALKTQVFMFKLIMRGEAPTPALLEALRSGIACGRRPSAVSSAQPSPLEEHVAASDSAGKVEDVAASNAAQRNGAPKAESTVAATAKTEPVLSSEQELPWKPAKFDHSVIATMSDRRLTVARERPDLVAPRFISLDVLKKERMRLMSTLLEGDAKARAAVAEACDRELKECDDSEADRLVMGDENPEHRARRNALQRKMLLARSSVRELSLIDLQRKVRASVLHENLTAQKEGKVGAKTRERVLRQLAREVERLEKARQKRMESAEKEMRRARAQWLGALSDHQSAFRTFHANARKDTRGVAKAVVRRCEEVAKKAERAEREAHKARMQKLMHEDEEGYLEMVRNTKNKRLLELLDQTDSYLKQLGAVVKQTRKSAERSGGGGGGSEELVGDGDAGDENKTYYEIAHQTKEQITEQPSIMVGGQLKEYQMQGLQWMVSLYNNRMNGILADEMGLGKTVQTISLIAHLMEKKGNPGPYMVVVPLSTLSNWELEFQRWVPSVRVVVFKGDKKVRKQLFDEIILPGAFNVCLITYEYVVRAKSLLRRVEWEYIIVDEGHRMKNSEARLSFVLGEFYTSRHRLLLTGTPLQNSLEELWALLNFILPTVFSSVDSFEQWFAGPFATRGGTDVQLNEEESLLVIFRLHQVLRPFLLRRLKSEVLKMGEKLPTKQEDVVMCDMSAWQRYIYKRMVHSERVPFTDNNGRRRYDKMSNPAMQLRKVVNHPYLFFEDYSNEIDDSPELWRASGKFDMLDACLLKLLRTGHRVLVFNQMTRVVDLQERLLHYRNIPFLRLDGSTRPEERKRLVEEFNTRQDYNVFLLTTRAGGLGVNLQTADTVIIFDSDWNPQADLQAQDRAHRIGQKRAVRILRFVTARSVEEDVIEKATFKRGLEAKIIQAGMFDEQSKDVDRQAMLRELLREEEEGSVQEDALPTPEELNKLLARNEEEEEIFAKVDQERMNEIGGLAPLIVKEEIPKWVTMPEEEAILKEEEERALGNDLEKSGRKRAASKNVSYLIDQMSDDKYLAMMEKGVTVDEFLSEKEARRVARQAKRKAAADQREKDETLAAKRSKVAEALCCESAAESSQNASRPERGLKSARNRLARRSMTESDLEQDITESPTPVAAEGGKRAAMTRRRRAAARNSPAASFVANDDEEDEEEDDSQNDIDDVLDVKVSGGADDSEEEQCDDSGTDEAADSASESEGENERRESRGNEPESEGEEDIEIEYEVDDDGDEQDGAPCDAAAGLADGRSELGELDLLEGAGGDLKDAGDVSDDEGDHGDDNDDDGIDDDARQLGDDESEALSGDEDIKTAGNNTDEELELSKTAELLKSDDDADPATLASPGDWTGYASSKAKDGTDDDDQSMGQWDALNTQLDLSLDGSEPDP